MSIRDSFCLSALKATAIAAGLAFALLLAPSVSNAADLGIEGQVYEPIEEDFRIMLMRLVARYDWTESQEELKQSARDYTKNLPSYMLPRAETLKTTWKDVGIVVTEDIFLPWVDYENGSIFAPEEKLAVAAGTYLNPIAGLPSAGIERLFVFDATDPDQLSDAKALMKENIPQLSFMLVAGDLGPLSEEMNRPVFHPPPTMLEKFHIKALPTLIGFGKGQHRGHMAVTELKLPVAKSDVEKAWFGLPYPGYDPTSLTDEVLDPNSFLRPPGVPTVAGSPDRK